MSRENFKSISLRTLIIIVFFGLGHQGCSDDATSEAERSDSVIVAGTPERSKHEVVPRKVVSPKLLKAFLSAFGQGRWYPSSEVKSLVSEACDEGDLVACDALDWTHSSVAEAFRTHGAQLAEHCDGGHWVACLGLGWTLSQLPLAAGIPSREALEPKRALELFKGICNLGHSEGCLEVVRLRAALDDTYEGMTSDTCALCKPNAQRACAMCIALKFDGGNQENTRGEWFERSNKACLEGEPLGCRLSGRLMAEGKGVVADLRDAGKWFNQGCNAGDMVACRLLAELYIKGRGVVRSLSEARALLERSCKGLDAVSCRELGLMYITGKGLPVNSRQGNKFFEHGCLWGDAEACTHLGWSFREGRGVSKDEIRAANLFQKGCRGASYLGCAYLAWGLGAEGRPEREQQEADRLFNLSCDQGIGFACNALATREEARSSASGTRVLSLYGLACSRRDADGCTNLSRLLRGGTFPDAAQRRGRTILEQSCKNEVAGACRNLEKITR